MPALPPLGPRGTSLALAALLVALLLLGCLVGASGFGLPEPVILWQVRVPRTLLAALLGAALALSGATLQGLLRNPLADPGLLGVSGSASLGAVLAFYFGLSTLFPLALPLAGIAGALLGTIALLQVARRLGSGSHALILAGIALSSITAAFLALALSLAPSPFAIAEITIWLLGSVADRSLLELALAAPFVLAGLSLLLPLGRTLDALTLGEDAARSLGLDPDAAFRRAAWGTALAVGSVTAVAGAVGFVGLIVPHLLRPRLGSLPSRLLLSSALGGAALVVAADCLVRLVPTGQELRLGVLTALLGAPLLLLLLRDLRPRP